jgi:uncharacterized membrane protein
MAVDPYAAPKSHVADMPSGADDGDFIPGGQGVSIGNGWNWISDAWALFAGQRATFIGIFLIFAVLVVVLSVIPFLGSLILALITPVLYGGIMLGCDAMRRGDQLEVGHLFAGFRTNTGKLIGVGAVTLAAFVAIFVLIMIIFGAGMAATMMGGGQVRPDEMAAGFAAMMVAVLVMAGLSIPVYMAIWYAAPLIVLNGHDVMPALKSSFFACLKNILPFLVWGIAFFVLAILASIPVMLGWLLLGPVMFASAYTSYRDIFYKH